MTWCWKRYTQVSFPPYRFRPGRHPHPTAHPQGHSYHAPGSTPPKVVFEPPQRWRESADYLWGCDLYNHAYWWEAHEAWEGLWQLTDKSDFQGQFLQTLIQVGAGHLKLELQRADGLSSLRVSSRGHFDRCLARAPAGDLMGLDLRAWYARADDYWEARLAHLPLAHDPATYPYIALAL